MFFTNYASNMGQMLEIVKGKKNSIFSILTQFITQLRNKFRNEDDVKMKGVLDEKIKWYKLK